MFHSQITLNNFQFQYDIYAALKYLTVPNNENSKAEPEDGRDGDEYNYKTKTTESMLKEKDRIQTVRKKLTEKTQCKKKEKGVL